MDNYNYPMGADTKDAPWNQLDDDYKEDSDFLDTYKMYKERELEEQYNNLYQDVVNFD